MISYISLNRNITPKIEKIYELFPNTEIDLLVFSTPLLYEIQI